VGDCCLLPAGWACDLYIDLSHPTLAKVNRNLEIFGKAKASASLSLSLALPFSISSWMDRNFVLHFIKIISVT